MTVYSQVLAASKRPRGMCVSDIPANPGTIASALLRAQKLGLVFVAKISHKKVRYFDTKARADACVATTSKPKSSGWGVGVKFPRHPRFDPDAPMVITPQTIFTFAPTPPRCFHTNTHGQIG